MRVLISGGGTGGHIYPAIAIADALKKKDKTIEILFVGANGRMEMDRIPKAGYDIRGIDIVGLQRRLTWKNLLFPFKVLKAMRQAKAVVKDFGPDVGVGVGGYASGPAMRCLANAGLPYVLQEQNSYPGITNKILARHASLICVGYPEMKRFFESSKLRFTGNPVRQDLLEVRSKRLEGIQYFGLDPNKRTCLIVGGSLGALTLNKAMLNAATLIKHTQDVQFVWQIGGAHESQFRDCETAKLPNVDARTFIDRMDLAYAVGDVLIARAGALTISELSVVGMPTILVPSPHVAEDHQTKNAMALVSKDAALLVRDSDAVDSVVQQAIGLLNDGEKREMLSRNVKLFGKPNAAEQIAEQVINVAKRN